MEAITMEKYTLTLIKAIANCEIEANIIQDAYHLIRRPIGS